MLTENQEFKHEMCRTLFALNLLTPSTDPLDVLMIFSKVTEDAEVWKRYKASYGPGGEGAQSTLQIVEAMTPTERQNLRARIAR
jgi:hypothetical protein